MGLFGKKKEPPKKRVVRSIPYVLDDGMKWIYCSGCRQYVVGKHIKHHQKESGYSEEMMIMRQLTFTEKADTRQRMGCVVRVQTKMINKLIRQTTTMIRY